MRTRTARSFAPPFSLAPSICLGTKTVAVERTHEAYGNLQIQLKAHRHLWSPNTVRGYATSLAQWWTFLEQRGEECGWQDVGVPTVTGFLAWLRNGRVLERSLVASQDAPSAQTLEARLAALISFYRWQGATFGVPVVGRLMRGAPHRAQARGMLAHLDARSGAWTVLAGARAGQPSRGSPTSTAARADPEHSGWMRCCRRRFG